MKRYIITSTWCEQIWSVSCFAADEEQARAKFYARWPKAPQRAKIVCVDDSPHMEEFWTGEEAKHCGPYSYGF
jgi:hypothetical protein